MTVLDATATLAPPAGLAQGVGTTRTAIGAVDAAAAKISALPTPDPGDTLAPHIETARAHAQAWTDTSRPLLVSLLAGVADFGKTFNDDYARLTELAKKIIAGDAGTKPALDALLTSWQKATGGEAAKAATALQSMSALEGDLQGDARTLGADQTSALAAAAAAQTAIGPLQQQIDATETKIAVEQGIEDSSLLGIIVQQLITQLTGQLSLFSSELDDLQEKLQAAQETAQQAAATAQLAGDYGTAVAAGSSAIQSLSNGWSVLNANFANLLQAERISDPSIFTSAELAAAKADWDGLVQQASGLN